MYNKYLVIDFDSTFVAAEGLEELAGIALKENPDKENILNKIRDITSLGMEGKISFTESLLRRLPLLQAEKRHVKELAELLRFRVTPSIARNVKFFRDNMARILIVSGGFKEFMLPVIADFGFDQKNIFGNTFKYDGKDRIIGFDQNNCLAREHGKALLLKSLKLTGDIIAIGDGWTDYEMKQLGPAKYFYAITENVRREKVLAVADRIMENFDEVADLIF